METSSARSGDTVKVHYTGRLEDGSVFDSSEGRDPLEFTIGQGQVITGFEDLVKGMAVGEEKSARIPAASAYGDRREDLVLDVERSDIPENIDPEVGQVLKLQQPDGQAFAVTVVKVTEAAVTLDANHSLAGKDLSFDVKLVEIA